MDDGQLKADVGRAVVRELPREETERRWRITTPQWPIMHAVTYGITRDQMMARHKSNHIQVAYAPERGRGESGHGSQSGRVSKSGDGREHLRNRKRSKLRKLKNRGAEEPHLCVLE